MTTKELIRKEIERRKGYISVTHFAEDLLSFLDTLPDEPVTDSHDLTEEAVSYCFDNGLNLSPRVATDFARHFAEWGANHLRDTTKKVSEDLEEAADEHIRKVADAAGHPGWDWETRDIEDAFIAGAEWQKRKMMDEAYEEEVQEVYRDDDGIHCCVSVGTDYKPGTIVYVITIPKEDEQ